MRKNIILAILIFISIPLVCLVAHVWADDQEQAAEKEYLQYVKSHGYLENYNRGKALLHELSSVGSDKRKKVDDAAHKREQVAFIGGCAAPGPINDLITAHGVYLRIVNEDGKDWRPTALWWTVLVSGEVLKVLPENKIIVLKVSKKDWDVLETG